MNDHLDIVKLLLDRCANIDAGDNVCMKSTLVYSVEQDNLNMVEKLLELGASIYAHDNYALRNSITIIRKWSRCALQRWTNFKRATEYIQ